MKKKTVFDFLLRILPIIVFLSGCTVGPDYKRPTVPIPESFKEFKEGKEEKSSPHPIAEKWWEIFNDPLLNRLEEQVAISNQSLAQAEAQYRQAQALVQSAKAAFSPAGTATQNVTRFRAASGQNVAVAGVRYLFNFALNAVWEPDLWGSVRRQVEANETSAQASAATLQALLLSTRATLAQNYFQLRTLDAQKHLLDDTVKAYKKTLELTQNQYAVGVVGKTDVIQAETQFRAAQAQAVDVGVLRAQLEHAIAILIGKSPSELTIHSDPNLLTPPLIPVDVPSSLLVRRPDIIAAERLTASANAKIGVAKAAFFPTLSLSATNGYQTNNPSELFKKATRYWALGPASLAYSVFDGGAKNAQMKQAIADFDTSVASYRQTVLTAFQEVEDNLASLRILNEELEIQNQTVTGAKEAVSLTTNQYKAGTVSYINVMTAQTTAYANEKTAVELLGQKLNAAVLLVKALGGGWNAAALPSKEQAGGKIKWYEFFSIPVN